jgi:parallel beta helix pectate lyase-like protein
MTTSRPLGVLLAALFLLLAACSAAPTTEAPQATGRMPWPAGLPVADPVSCPAPTVRAGTSAELRSALRDAAPGTVIGLADGTYDGTFSASGAGTAREPIWVCGGRDAVLRGPGSGDGTVLHLDRTAHWRLVGFTVREGRKGVMVDDTRDAVLQDLTVTGIGDEAVHLRTNSTGNVVRGLTISDTGLRREKFGEGVYVGSAVSNWCDVTACEPDRSDRNVIVANTISRTTAESVDLKEGTTGGVVADNTFDGAGLRGDADSWVDVKGNGWLVQGNRGTTAPTSGFEVNVQADGWGTGNTFDANVADVAGSDGDGSGFGIELRPPTDEPTAGNRVTCTNTASGAARGLTNTTCA